MDLMDLTDSLLDELPIRQTLLILGLVVLISTVAAELGLNDTTACSIGYAAAILVVGYFQWYCTECSGRFQNTDRSPARRQEPIYQITLSLSPKIHREQNRRTPDRIVLVGTFQPFQELWEPRVHNRIFLNYSAVPTVDKSQDVKFTKKVRCSNFELSTYILTQSYRFLRTEIAHRLDERAKLLCEPDILNH